jgi:hypothetical protein
MPKNRKNTAPIVPPFPEPEEPPTVADALAAWEGLTNAAFRVDDCNLSIEDDRAQDLLDAAREFVRIERALERDQ